MASSAHKFVNLVILPESGATREPSPDGIAPALVSFEIHDVDLCVVNALRRTVMSDVQTAAIAFDPTGALGETESGIKFIKNTSVLHNEFLGHRISLVPLGFDMAQLRAFDASQYKFVLEVKNAGKTVLDVTTRDFKVLGVNDAEVSAEMREAIFPPSKLGGGKYVLLARLKPSSTIADGNGEALHVECRARIGSGHEHTRWSPVSLCFFKNKVDPKLFEASIAKKVQAALDVPGVDKASLMPEGAALEALRRQHAALDGHRDFYRNDHGEPSVFEFKFETVTRLRPAFVVLEGFRALSGKVRRLVRGLQRKEDAAADVGADDDAATVTVTLLQNMDDYFEIGVQGEDHTLGNLVQGLLYQHWIRDGKSTQVSFIGYHRPHPLEDHIMFKVKLAQQGSDVRDVMLEGLDAVIKHLGTLEAEWIAFALGNDADVTWSSTAWTGVRQQKKKAGTTSKGL